MKKTAYLVYCTEAKNFIITGMPMQPISNSYIDVAVAEVEFAVPCDYLNGSAELQAIKLRRAQLADETSKKLHELDAQINKLEAKNAD